MRQVGFKYWCIIIGLFLLGMACNSNQNGYKSRPAKSAANPQSDLLDVNAIAYHFNDSLTRIMVEIKNKNLLYKRPDTSQAFYASVKLQFALRTDAGSKRIIDSSSFFMQDRSISEYVGSKSIYFSFLTKVNKGVFDLDLDVWDLNRRVRYKKPLTIIKNNRQSAQNFLVYERDSVSFKTSFAAGQELLVEYAYNEVQSLRVDCYLKEFGPALPPFSTKQVADEAIRPDSTFYINLNNRQCKLIMPAKGFYQMRAAGDAIEGLSLYTVDESFPGVSNSREMVQCTRYIMARDEYEACLDAVDNKVAIDAFWLRIGGSQERARELLKRYYGRVKDANINYSSFVPGWKTDRGMIYIVMGPPYNILRDGDRETWVYGNDANPNSLRFVFNKKRNAFTENDYVMERSVFYRDHYHSAVEAWRQGVVFNESPR